RNGELNTINGGTVKTYPPTSMAHVIKAKGGVQIPSIKGIVIDHGWRRGKSPIEGLNRNAEVRDRNGKRCGIKNSDILKAVPYDVERKFKTNSAWSKFVANRCPNLKWTSEPFKTELGGSRASFKS